MAKKTKTDPRQLLIGKHVMVRKNNWMLKFEIESINGYMYEGKVEWVDENCPFMLNDVYSVSENEIKYHTIISK